MNELMEFAKAQIERTKRKSERAAEAFARGNNETALAAMVVSEMHTALGELAVAIDQRLGGTKR